MGYSRPIQAQAQEAHAVQTERVPTGVALVVDDDPTVRDVLRDILEMDGWRVEAVSMAPEAVLRLATQPYDLLVVDLHLPAVSGQALLRRAKALRPRMPVLVITGFPSVSVAVQVMKAGATDFLEKPFHPHQVRRAVREAMARRQRQGTRSPGTVNRAMVVRDHAERVTSLSLLMAETLGYGPEALKALKEAGFLCDLGMLGIREEVLEKPTSLTPEEFGQVKDHPRVACQIARPLGVGQETLAAIRHHHEHWDGSGYPDGLSGERIPALARILHTADAYDAMTHPRPYQPCRSPSQALAEIQRLAGSQFDPQAVESLTQVVGFQAVYGWAGNGAS